MPLLCAGLAGDVVPFPISANPVGAVVKRGGGHTATEGREATSGLVNQEVCEGWGSCAEVCPTKAITLEETALVDAEQYNEYRACVDQCPSEAVTIQT